MTAVTTTPTAAAPLSRDESGRHLGQTMGLVAIAAGLFALGAYVGRNAPGELAIVWFLAALAVLLNLNVALRRSSAPFAMGLLFGFGALMGLAVSPTLVYLGGDPEAIWQAGGATALLVAGLGAAGYAIRRDPRASRERSGR